MLSRSAVACVLLSSLIAAYPQSRYETEQDSTDAPDAQFPPEPVQTERTAAKQFVKPYKTPRNRPQPQQQYQSQQQQYQADSRAASQQQAVQSTPQQTRSQYENQYDSQYVNQAPASQYSQQPQQVARQEHRHSTTTFIPIIRQDKTQSLDGSYQQSWESGNHITAQENGYLKHISKDQDALVQQGNYSYTAPDGSLVWTSYTADEGGFQVQGSHLPTPPPIPEEILKGLQQIYEGIRLQQEADARDAKSGKSRTPVSDEDNSVASDNYPIQYQQYQRQQQQQVQQQPLPQQQQQQPLPQQQQQQQLQRQQYQRQQQQPQYQEQPQTYRPPATQTYRKVQQRPKSQQYQQIQQPSQSQVSRQQSDQSESEQYEQ